MEQFNELYITSDDTKKVINALQARNEGEITRDEEKDEIRTLTDWSVTTFKIFEALRREGIHNIRMAPSFYIMQVYQGIYKLAYYLGAKVIERYNPESEDYPFVYEFEYQGVVFRFISAEHINCPEEYKDA